MEILQSIDYVNILILILVLLIAFVLYKMFVSKPLASNSPNYEVDLPIEEEPAWESESESESEIKLLSPKEKQIYLNLLLFLFYVKYFSELGTNIGITLTEEQTFKSKDILNYIYEFISDEDVSDDIFFENFNIKRFKKLYRNNNKFINTILEQYDDNFTFNFEGFQQFNQQIIGMLRENKIAPKRNEYSIEGILEKFNFVI